LAADALFASACNAGLNGALLQHTVLDFQSKFLGVKEGDLAGDDSSLGGFLWFWMWLGEELGGHQSVSSRKDGENHN
jgi:hypothetical protein